MKTLILALLTCGLAQASEFQMLEGQEAYDLYLTLPGVRCIEWNSKDFIVYTKYQTKTCSEQGDSTQWTCTVQIKKSRPKKFDSASCTREIP